MKRLQYGWADNTVVWTARDATEELALGYPVDVLAECLDAHQRAPLARLGAYETEDLDWSIPCIRVEDLVSERMPETLGHHSRQGYDVDYWGLSSYQRRLLK